MSRDGGEYLREAEVRMNRECPRAMDAAVYLLDGLAGAEADAFLRHLDSCRGCRAEIEELAPVARLLAVVRSRSGRP
jgi:hypothetical protein